MKEQIKINKFKLELEVYFNDPKDIANKIWEIVENIKEGKYYQNKGDFNYNVLLTKEPKFRIEEHNGVEYIVYPSKLNYDYDY